VRISPNSERRLRALAVEIHENWLEQHRYSTWTICTSTKKAPAPCRLGNRIAMPKTADDALGTPDVSPGLTRGSPLGGGDAGTPRRHHPTKPDERQARHRARLRQPAQASPPTSVRRSLPDYRTWLDSVPANPEGSRLAE
jgi:hypothetical protein